jgi:hypothetical protein
MTASSAALIFARSRPQKRCWAGKSGQGRYRTWVRLRRQLVLTTGWRRLGFPGKDDGETKPSSLPICSVTFFSISIQFRTCASSLRALAESNHLKSYLAVTYREIPHDSGRPTCLTWGTNV